MRGKAQGPSGAMENKEHRSNQSGAMEKEHRSNQPGAMENKKHGSNQAGATQGSPRTSEFGSISLSSDQRTKIQQTVANGNIHHVDHVDFCFRSERMCQVA